MLAYMLVVVAFCTLSPPSFTWPTHLRVSFEFKFSDAVLNVFLFVIPGFFYQASRHGHTRALLHGLLFGLSCSLLIEVTQLLLPARYPSPIDLATNALGAALGALLYASVQSNLQERAVHRFLLELPLMGSFYLLIPLLWLTGLTATTPSDLMAAPCLGVMGAIILASVWKHRLREFHCQAWVGLATGVWYLVGSLPALIKWPVPVALSTALVGMTAFALTSRSWMCTESRRFELFTLGRAMPLFALYLLSPLCFAYVPLASTYEIRWHGFAAQGVLLSSVEHLTAFSILGYLVGESTGRWDTSGWVPPLIAVATSIGIVLLLRSAGHAPRGFSTRAALVLALGGALCGVAIYLRQLTALRELLAAQPRGLLDEHVDTSSIRNIA